MGNNKRAFHVHIIMAVVLVAILLGGFVFAKNKLCWNRHSIDRYHAFWDDPSQYDIWFMGSSHMYYSVQPMKLWEDYGYTSYDIATPSSTIPTTYWILMNALEKSTPKLIVVDAYHIDMNEKVVTMTDKLHWTFDAVPMSITKVKAINDLFETPKERREFLLPLYDKDGKHAEEIKALTKYQFPLSKGNLMMEKAEDISGNQIVPANEGIQDETLGMIYMRKIIDECKKRDIDLIITALPYAGEQIKQKGLHAGIKLAKEEGMPVLDYSYCPDILDYSVSFSEDGHPNAYGGTVMTKQIGDYIKANYNITDHRKGDKKTSDHWNSDLEKLEKKYLDRLEKRKSLKECCIWLARGNRDVEIYIEDEILLNNATRILIDLIPEKKTITKAEAAKYAETKAQYDTLIVAKDKLTGETIYKACFKKGRKVKK